VSSVRCRFSLIVQARLDIVEVDDANGDLVGLNEPKGLQAVPAGD
jgi:hypothetical protein